MFFWYFSIESWESFLIVLIFCVWFMNQFASSQYWGSPKSPAWIGLNSFIVTTRMRWTKLQRKYFMHTWPKTKWNLWRLWRRFVPINWNFWTLFLCGRYSWESLNHIKFERCFFVLLRIKWSSRNGFMMFLLVSVLPWQLDEWRVIINTHVVFYIIINIVIILS